MNEEVKQRKAEHVSVALGQDVSVPQRANWSDIQLVHQALPEVDLDEIDTAVDFLGRALRCHRFLRPGAFLGQRRLAIVFTLQPAGVQAVEQRRGDDGPGRPGSVRGRRTHTRVEGGHVSARSGRSRGGGGRQRAAALGQRLDPPAVRPTEQPPTNAPSEEQSTPTDGSTKPGWGCGDKNHTHTGPPAKGAGNGSPC